MSKKQTGNMGVIELHREELEYVVQEAGNSKIVKIDSINLHADIEDINEILGGNESQHFLLLSEFRAHITQYQTYRKKVLSTPEGTRLHKIALEEYENFVTQYGRAVYVAGLGGTPKGSAEQS